MKYGVKNTIIGFFILTAIGTTIWLILFLKPSVGNGEKVYLVRFTNISGISVGTRVTFAGRAIGEVACILEICNAREGPVDSLGRVYFYQLVLQVDSSIEIYDTDEITLQTIGLMGEKTVAIVPKGPLKGVVPKPVAKNQIIYANSLDPLENALNNFSKVSNYINTLVMNLDNWFMKNKEEISYSISSFSDAMASLHTVLASVDREQLVYKITQTVDSLHQDLDLAADVLIEIRDEGKKILHNLTLITTDIAFGKGTLGKLVISDDIYLKSSAILSKANTMMNDINQYGFLFQYNKQWQKSRVKRANLVTALHSAKDFQKFFESEIDTIQCSLQRLGKLLEKAESPEEKEKIYNNSCFKMDFHRLMQEIDTLYNNIKIYNEELLDKREGDCN